MKQFGEAGIGTKGIQLHDVAGFERKAVPPVCFRQKRDALVTVPQSRIDVCLVIQLIGGELRQNLLRPGNVARLRKRRSQPRKIPRVLRSGAHHLLAAPQLR
jgi:hypothetical protein